MRCRVLSLVAAVAVLLCGTISPVHAESGEEQNDSGELVISTDRPGAGDGTGIVPKNHFQIESGINAGFEPGGSKVNFGDTLVRYGITEFVEARFFASLLGLGSDAAEGTRLVPLGNLTLAAKVSRALGDDAVVAALPFVAVDDATLPGRSWSGGIRLAADLATNEPVNLTFNLGASAVEKSGGGFGMQGFGAAAVNASISESIGSFFEVYAVAEPESQMAVFLDSGVTYGLTDRLQVDGWLGFEVLVQGSRSFGVGISYLI